MRLATRDEFAAAAEGRPRPVPGPPLPHILSLQAGESSGLERSTSVFVSPLLFLGYEEILHYMLRSLHDVMRYFWRDVLERLMRPVGQCVLEYG